MRSRTLALSGAVLFLTVAIAVSAAAATRIAPDPSDADAAPRPERANPNPALVYPAGARPFGAGMEEWSERLWRWLYSIPADRNPLLDTGGQDCDLAQDGPVWFLPTVVDPGGLASFQRSCTIPRHKAVLMQLSGILNDYPCPDPAFQPAPGQSLFAFLSSGAAQVVDAVDSLSVSVDGRALREVMGYRVASDDLFHFTGDSSLSTTIDGCVTGSSQPGVSDGYFLMLRPLAPGDHVIVTRATDTHGTDVTLTYLIHVP